MTTMMLMPLGAFWDYAFLWQTLAHAFLIMPLTKGQPGRAWAAFAIVVQVTMARPLPFDIEHLHPRQMLKPKPQVQVHRRRVNFCSVPVADFDELCTRNCCPGCWEAGMLAVRPGGCCCLRDDSKVCSKWPDCL